ncbi:PP2C family protein-serine/threonine phosphatase [Treponema bryantii]|nr:PP2C family protein-serine/threonine phosphatase [Treponema bryantii]
MFYYNFVSITIFTLILIFVPRLKSFVFVYNIGLLEVIVHQIMADYYLGSYSSFHSFILLMGLLPFLIFENKKRYALPITALSSLLYIYFSCRNIEAHAQVTAGTLFGIRCMNITITVFIILFVVLIYTRVVYRIEYYLKNHSDSLENEIKMAAIIQQNFFRQEIENIKKYEVGYFSRPMVGVSGDLYDFYKTGEKLDGLGVFDVSGHGISSGLVTMLVKNIIHQEFYNQPDVELWEIVNKINDRVIEEKGEIQNYLTGILVRLYENKFELVDAGHPAPILYKKKTGECSFVQLGEKAVGVIGIAGFPVYYESLYYDFEDGDELILFSDGVIDIKNEKDEYFGKERLLEAAKLNIEKSAAEQVSFIANSIYSFCGTREQNDDLTIIVLKK